MFEGREHLVVPVIALMEGVIHAVNAENPEYVPARALGVAPQSWNGRPLMLGHPSRNGVQISANDARVLESQSFGRVFNTRFDGRRLLMDAYIDPAKTEQIGGSEMLRRLRNNELCEVSVGAFVTTDPQPGEYNGKKYKAVWNSISPDHLAFLPQGRGACSAEMGCGANRAAAAFITAEGYREVTEEELKTMAEARAEEDAELITWQSMRDHCDILDRIRVRIRQLVDELISAEGTHVEGLDESDETVVERARLEAIGQLAYSAQSVVSGISSLCIKSLSPHGESVPSPAYNAMLAEFVKDVPIVTLAENGVKLWEAVANESVKALSLNKPEQEVENKQVTAAGDAPAAADKVAGSACGCKGDKNMTKEQRAEMIATLIACKHSGFTEGDQAMLDNATDDRLEAFKVASEARMRTETDLKAAAAKPLTEEEFMANAPESLRSLIARQQRQETAFKAELVAELKAAQEEYSETELSAMPIEQLQRMARVARIEVQPDFSGRGLPRVLSSKKEDDVYANPPDPYAADIERRRAAQGR